MKNSTFLFIKHISNFPVSTVSGDRSWPLLPPGCTTGGWQLRETPSMLLLLVSSHILVNGYVLGEGKVYRGLSVMPRPFGVGRSKFKEMTHHGRGAILSPRQHFGTSLPPSGSLCFVGPFWVCLYFKCFCSAVFAYLSLSFVLFPIWFSVFALFCFL